MTLVTNRDILKRHLQNRVAMLEAQLRQQSLVTATISATATIRLKGNIAGIQEALEAIEAWEKHDLDQTIVLPGEEAAPPPPRPACEHLPDPLSFKVDENYDVETERGAVMTFRCARCGATGNAKLGGSIDLSTLAWDPPKKPQWAGPCAWLADYVKELEGQQSWKNLAELCRKLAGEVEAAAIENLFFHEMELSGYGRT